MKASSAASGHEAGHDRHRFRPLQGKKRVLVGADEVGPVAERRGDQGEVLLLGRRIDDDIERAGRLRSARAIIRSSRVPPASFSSSV